MTYENVNERRLKLCFSSAMSLGLIFIVGVSAFLALLISFIGVPKLCVDLDPGSTLACAQCERSSWQHIGDTATDSSSWQHIDDTATGPTLVPVEGVYTEYECEVTQNVNKTNTWHSGYPEGSGMFAQNKWKWTSALVNTVMIVVFGMLYESIAEGLNEWENHRTQIDYEDNLILKNFMFQFVNNYFILFYIGYMRQLKVPGVDIDAECKSGSCLTMLQVQVGVVFTTKTFFAQLMEVIGPTLKARARTYANILQINQMQKALMKVNTDLQQAMMPEAVEKFVGVNEEAVLRQEAIARKKEAMVKRLEAAEHFKQLQQMEITGEVPVESLGADAEAQSFCEPYTSTFDDFNEMAIQFGCVMRHASCVMRKQSEVLQCYSLSLPLF